MILLLLLAALLIGTPLFIVIASNAFLGYARADEDLSLVAINFYGLAETPIVLAIPLFTLAGYLLSASQAPSRLVRVTNALLGWMRGGLAVVTLITSALFAAFTGVSGINIIALGALLFPALVQARYAERFGLGLITTAGSVGLLIAPSLPLILYAVIARQPVDQLFLAGLLPALLIVAVLCAWSLANAPKRSPDTPRADWREVRAAIRDAAWELPLPFVVLGGIYSGRFAVSDAAVVTLLYVFIVEVLIRREIPWTHLPGIVRDCMIMVGGILMVLGASLASTDVMIDQGVPQRLLEWLSGSVETRAGFLCLLLAFFLVLGAIVDIFSAIVLVVPLLLPAAETFGVHPVHLGIMLIAAMELGYITPPFGLNLFISSYRFDRPITSVFRSTVPFYLVQLTAVIVIVAWPLLSLWWAD
jgi:tripartite ATP-independent transporter DctM subunit